VGKRAIAPWRTEPLKHLFQQAFYFSRVIQADIEKLFRGPVNKRVVKSIESRHFAPAINCLFGIPAVEKARPGTLLSDLNDHH
jgi:hypothetical protein